MLLHNTTSLREMRQELATKSSKELIDIIMHDNGLDFKVDDLVCDARNLLIKVENLVETIIPDTISDAGDDCVDSAVYYILEHFHDELKATLQSLMRNTIENMFTEALPDLTTGLADIIMNYTVHRTLADLDDRLADAEERPADESPDTVDIDSLIPLLKVADLPVLICGGDEYDVNSTFFDFVSEKEASRLTENSYVTICDALDAHSRERGITNVINGMTTPIENLTKDEITERIKWRFRHELFMTIRMRMKNTIDDKFTAAVLDTVVELEERERKRINEIHGQLCAKARELARTEGGLN